MTGPLSPTDPRTDPEPQATASSPAATGLRPDDGPTRRERARALFARQLALLETGDIAGWVALFHPDGVLEFPYAPPGFPGEVSGAAAIHAHMRNFPEQLDVTFSEVTYHDTVDADLVVAEFGATGTALVSGRPFAQRYVSLLWLSDGRITRYRDYWNPLAVLAAIGGPETFRTLFADDPART